MIELEDVNIQTRAKNYETQEKEPKVKELLVPETTPLQMKKPLPNPTTSTSKVTSFSISPPIEIN